jgi:predicted YcjX-like family ATPase
MLRKIRVGMIGMYQSGKTVLLSALINHLKNHDADRLPLGSDNAGIGFLPDEMPAVGVGAKG